MVSVQSRLRNQRAWLGESTKNACEAIIKGLGAGGEFNNPKEQNLAPLCNSGRELTQGRRNTRVLGRAEQQQRDESVVETCVTDCDPG